MRSRILLGTIFGAIGGFVGYLLQERLVPHDPVLDTTLADMMRLGALVGAMLGLGIGAVEGSSVGSPRLLLRGLVLGAVVGAIGGMFGVYFGMQAFGLALFGKDPRLLMQSRDIADFTHLILARALGWTFLGALPGLAAGAATLSPKRATHGLIGGLIGGFVGGLFFDLVGSLITQPIQGVAGATVNQTIIETGGPSRAVGFTLIGLFTGLFIGLVEELLKQGWVRVLAGRNEGRDYILSKQLTVIGRDERADVPVYGDPMLAPQHAAIRVEGGRHILLDGGVPPGPVVNGTPVQGRQLLRDGDMIQLGQVRVLFHEKATAARVGRPAADVPSATGVGPAMPMPSHLCPFCGAAKDARGNCLCSVGAGVSPAAAGATAPGVSPYPVPQSAPSYVPTPGQSFALGGPGTQIAALVGPYAGTVFAIALPSVVVGRDPASDIALTNDTTVSRRHARIVLENGSHVVYDDGSSNGTFVNGVRLPIQTLARGDVVQFGASKFRYE